MSAPQERTFVKAAFTCRSRGGVRRWRSGCGTWRPTPSKIRDQAPGADGAEPQQKRHERSDFSAAGRFGAPERNTPPRADMRDHDVDQRRRDQQQLGLERRIAHYMRPIGAEQQESHADREEKTEA